MTDHEKIELLQEIVNEYRARTREVSRTAAQAAQKPVARSSTDTTALADALEKADWSGVSIGNKVMLKGAIEILRSIGVAQAPPVKDQAALFRVCQRRK
jgi:uncharacterized membrane protein